MPLSQVEPQRRLAQALSCGPAPRHQAEEELTKEALSRHNLQRRRAGNDVSKHGSVSRGTNNGSGGGRLTGAAYCSGGGVACRRAEGKSPLVDEPGRRSGLLTMWRRA